MYGGKAGVRTHEPDKDSGSGIGSHDDDTHQDRRQRKARGGSGEGVHPWRRVNRPNNTRVRGSRRLRRTRGNLCADYLSVPKSTYYELVKKFADRF